MCFGSSNSSWTALGCYVSRLGGFEGEFKILRRSQLIDKLSNVAQNEAYEDPARFRRLTEHYGVASAFGHITTGSICRILYL